VEPSAFNSNGNGGSPGLFAKKQQQQQQLRLPPSSSSSSSAAGGWGGVDKSSSSAPPPPPSSSSLSSSSSFKKAQKSHRVDSVRLMQGLVIAYENMGRNQRRKAVLRERNFLANLKPMLEVLTLLFFVRTHLLYV
jgi:hypothetical protein